RRAVWAMIAGVAATWASQGAVFMVLGVSVVLVWQSRRQGVQAPGARSALYTVMAAWVTSALATTLAGWAKLTPGTRSYVHQYWAGGFMPMPPWQASTLAWP